MVWGSSPWVGFTLALGVLVDAFVVRIKIVAATMHI
jgi:uncharacterized membrane protein YdfJ with MMPL/SSD domain